MLQTVSQKNTVPISSEEADMQGMVFAEFSLLNQKKMTEIAVRFLILKYLDVFALNPLELGSTDLTTHFLDAAWGYYSYLLTCVTRTFHFLYHS